MGDEEEPPPVDPLVVVEEKYAPLIAEKTVEREAIAKTLEALVETFSAELAQLSDEFQKAKSSGQTEQQVMLGESISKLQVRRPPRALGSAPAPLGTRTTLLAAPRDHDAVTARLAETRLGRARLKPPRAPAFELVPRPWPRSARRR
eukprot:931850-Prymnesium_polylepis.1